MKPSSETLLARFRIIEATILESPPSWNRQQALAVIRTEIAKLLKVRRVLA